MPRLTPLHWRRLVCVFEQIGYRIDRQTASHIQMTKPGAARPLTVPRYPEIRVPIIGNLIRTSGITRDAFLALLENC
jgi:predicted RNA binding protein YcfA (HicA-like mRNA interferase family)